MKFIRMVIRLFPSFQRKQVRTSPVAVDREHFMNEMKDQLVQLKEKGLGITVFTL